MGRSTPTQHGASARAGRPPSTGKTAARKRTPAPASRSSKAATVGKSAAKPRSQPAAKPRTEPTRKPLAKSRGSLPVVPIAIVASLVLLAWFLYPVLRLRYQEQRKYDQLEQQLTQVRQRNSRLKQDVQRLQTPAGIEAAARDLGLAKKGEQVYVTVPVGKKVAATQSPSLVQAADTTPDQLTRVLDFLFGVGK